MNSKVASSEATSAANFNRQLILIISEEHEVISDLNFQPISLLSSDLSSNFCSQVCKNTWIAID